MLPSRRLIIMVLPAALIFLAGAYFKPLTGLGLIYVLVLAACVLFDALLLPRRRGIVIERLAGERISLGVRARVCFRIRNATRRRLRIQLAEDLPVGLDGTGVTSEGLFDGGAEGTLEYSLTASARGRYELADVDVRVLPALGLLYRQYRLKIPLEVQVYPNLLNLRRYDLMLRRGLLYEQGLARQRLIGQGYEFESLRQYAPGDDMSRVDWKATARRRKLMVRNYAPERRQSILIALDVGRATAAEFDGVSRLDHFVSASLMLAFVAMRQGDWISLVAFSDRIESYLPPVRGAKSIERVVRALCDVKPRLVAADYAGACRFLGLRNRKRSLICLMTDVIDHDASAIVIAYLARFARHHLPLAVTLKDPDLHALASESLATSKDIYAKAIALDVIAARQEALTDMRRRGVSVLDVPPKSLTPDLINRYLQIKSAGRL